MVSKLIADVHDKKEAPSVEQHNEKLTDITPTQQQLLETALYTMQ
jgi:hypothetical protein